MKRFIGITLALMLSLSTLGPTTVSKAASNSFADGSGTATEISLDTAAIGKVDQGRDAAVWYKFTASSDLLWYQIEVSNSDNANQFYWDVYNSDGLRIIDGRVVDANNEIYACVQLEAKKTYYICIYFTGHNSTMTASYSVKVATETDESSSINDAKKISLKEEYKGKVTAKDVDYYEFKTKKKPSYRFEISSIGYKNFHNMTRSMSVKVVDKNDKVYHSIVLSGDETKSFTLNLKKKTKYYIRVEGQDNASTGYVLMKVTPGK